ncbi:hypothetical protein [Thermus phage TSP4]|nr:hypothetical protein [Thermus phage TSP4]
MSLLATHTLHTAPSGRSCGRASGSSSGFRYFLGFILHQWAQMGLPVGVEKRKPEAFQNVQGVVQIGLGHLQGVGHPYLKRQVVRGGVNVLRVPRKLALLRGSGKHEPVLVVGKRELYRALHLALGGHAESFRVVQNSHDQVLQLGHGVCRNRPGRGAQLE